MANSNEIIFMRAQRKRIEIDKWNEGCRIQTDPGQSYVLNWIILYAAQFRSAWKQSLCQSCRFAEECGHQVTRECDRFSNEDNT